MPVNVRKESTTVGDSSRIPITNNVTTMIAASEAGTTLVNFGRKWMIAIVSATRPSMIASGLPAIHSICPSTPAVLNCPSCARKITIASPLTNPSITGCGTMRMNLPSLRTPASTCRTPIRTTAANMYSIPCSATSATSTTASAPVAPEIIPGRPPKTAVIRPTMKAA